MLILSDFYYLFSKCQEVSRVPLCPTLPASRRLQLYTHLPKDNASGLTQTGNGANDSHNDKSFENYPPRTQKKKKTE